MGVAKGERDLVGDLAQEGDGRVLVGLGVLAVDGEHGAGVAALQDRDPDAGAIAGAGELGLQVGARVVEDRARDRHPGRAARDAQEQRLAVAAAQHAHGAGGVLVGDHQLDHVDRQQLAERLVQRGDHAALVEGRRQGPGDRVEGAEADRLVAGDLVEVGVGGEDTQVAGDLLQELDLGGRHHPVLVGLVQDGADDRLALLEGREDDGARDLASAGAAGALGAHLDRRVDDLGLARLVEGREERLHHEPPLDVLQDALVDADRVVPAFALEHGEGDHVVAVHRPQVLVEHLNDVRFGGAAAQRGHQPLAGGSRRIGGRRQGVSHRRRYTAAKLCRSRHPSLSNRPRGTYAGPRCW